MHIRSATLTHIGLHRRLNEDAAISEEHQSLALFGIADGMGGHACGDIASTRACRELEGFIHDCGAAAGCIDRLERRFFAIDASLRAYGEQNRRCRDLGTTLSVLLLAGGGTVAIAHVGDSRIHRLRGGSIRRLTTDHSFVEEMVAEGLLSREAASRHPLRNKLTRAVGTGERLEAVQTATFPALAGDRYLLSTDGLHEGVDEAEIEGILAGAVTPHQAAEELVGLALQRGGRDNITVITIFLE